MPELPEVETTRRGIEPHVLGRTVRSVIVREPRLRWRVPDALARELPGARIDAVARRAKYLLLRTARGHVLVHLGMSGSLRIVPATTPPVTHDHVDIVFDDGVAMRLRDPRRFGSVLWLTGDPLRSKLLKDLGPEPLSDAFDGRTLFERASGRSAAIKHVIMDAHVVVGVGNIYASEALHRARIHPLRGADRIARERFDALADSIKDVLRAAITAGGTTLRDFAKSDGEPGYFAQELAVYERAGEPCRICATSIKTVRSGQRSTYWCPRCQR
ncbi:MAG: bifunctional DNA-formamidopyrimidine glycosylase/DNA-(apurinic or apyrimidinic site) lyase [Planctomycetes bacterium]|nr:bifunctional DNA-formamidopyrimidine glycosylase/DNA-(apurinic or apyrimidinic site) lyase [Planctomycetota bacterium]